MSDPTDLTAFRSQLPTALFTTFIGLIGAIVLSVLSGVVESGLEDAAQLVRNALLEGFDGESYARIHSPTPRVGRESPTGRCRLVSRRGSKEIDAWCVMR